MSIIEWNDANKAVSQGFQFGFCFDSVDTASPLSELQDGAVAKQSVRAASSHRFQAGPLPVLTALDHVGAQRVSFQVAQHCQIVFIGLDWKRFESLLPDMAAPL